MFSLNLFVLHQVLLDLFLQLGRLLAQLKQFRVVMRCLGQ
jgi:hypothetical protein